MEGGYIRYLTPSAKREPDFVPAATAAACAPLLWRSLGAPLTTAIRATTFAAQRKQCRPCSLVQAVQSAALQAPCGSTTAPKRCSPRATASRKRDKKRDILRRTAMHASHRRELLVPREKKRPVESQRASSHTPREFMAVQKRRFYVLRMPSPPHP